MKVWIYSSALWTAITKDIFPGYTFRSVRNDISHGAIVVAKHFGAVDCVVIQWDSENTHSILISSPTSEVKRYNLADAVECLKAYAVMMS